MSHRGRVLVVLMIAAPLSSATAEPILYAVKCVASATVGGVPFTDEPLVFAGVTDTDTALTAADPAQPGHIIAALSSVTGLVSWLRQS
jgi:hypothetical protein